MQHPTKAQVQVVIDTLYKAKELAQGNCPVDMMQGIVKNNHPCGTPHCHGGWYAIASGMGGTYSAGSIKMAKYLGFESSGDLTYWADGNSNIWSNSYGGYMFCDGLAFGMDSDKGDLQQIIDHWKGVQERLPV